MAKYITKVEIGEQTITDVISDTEPYISNVSLTLSSGMSALAIGGQASDMLRFTLNHSPTAFMDGQVGCVEQALVFIEIENWFNGITNTISAKYLVNSLHQSAIVKLVCNLLFKTIGGIRNLLFNILDACHIFVNERLVSITKPYFPFLFCLQQTITQQVYIRVLQGFRKIISVIAYECSVTVAPSSIRFLYLVPVIRSYIVNIFLGKVIVRHSVSGLHQVTCSFREYVVTVKQSIAR